MTKMVYSLSISHPDCFDRSVTTSIFFFQKRPSKKRIINNLNLLKCSAEVDAKMAYKFSLILNILNKYPIPNDDNFVISTEIYTTCGIQPGIIKLMTVPLF